MSSTEPLPAFDSETKPKYTESPNPGFAYGRKVEDTPEGKKWLEGHKEGWKTIETASEDPAYVPATASKFYPRGSHQQLPLTCARSSTYRYLGLDATTDTTDKRQRYLAVLTGDPTLNVQL